MALDTNLENSGTYYHGPSGTHGTTDAACGAATAGSPVPAEFRIFAADHVYRLDGTGAQVPCSGMGTFSRTTQADDPNWVAEWTSAQDCAVVGNEAGTPRTGVSRAGATVTHGGRHAPCFNPTCLDNFHVDFKQYPAPEGLHLGMSGPAQAQVGDPVAVVARLTQDGVAVPSTAITYTVSGPAPGAPPGGSAVTGADGRASFTVSAAAAGDYIVRASATTATGTAAGTLAVRFVPPPPPAMALTGPARAQTEESVPVAATLTNAGRPAPGAEVTFTVDGPGHPNPSSGTATTDANGKAAFRRRARKRPKLHATSSRLWQDQGSDGFGRPRHVGPYNGAPSRICT